MTTSKHLDGPTLEALAAGASMPEAKFHVVECDECRAKLAAMRWENALFAGELREAGEHRAASGLPAPAPLPPEPLHAQTTWWGSTFSGGFAVPSAVAAVLVLGSAVALAAFLFGSRGGEQAVEKGNEKVLSNTVQAAGDGDEKTKEKEKDGDKATERSITWKGKSAKQWLTEWKTTRTRIAEDPKDKDANRESDQKMLKEAREALVKLSAVALPVLTEAICAKEDQRELLAGMIADMRPRADDVPAFVALLNDEHFREHFEIRIAIIHALTSLVRSDARVEAALRSAAKDRDLAVVEAAKEALAQAQAPQDERRQMATEFLAMANKAEAAAKYAEAAKAYSKCLEVDPNIEQAKAGLARTRKAIQESVQAAKAAERIETTLVPREPRLAEGEGDAVVPQSPPLPNPVPATPSANAPDAAPASSLPVFPQTFATQASKDAAIAQAKAVIMEHEANLELARREFDNFRAVQKMDAVSNIEGERARTKVAVCTARLDAAKAQLKGIESCTVAKDAAAAPGMTSQGAGDEVARLREQVEKLTQVVQKQQQAVNAARDEQARMRQGPPQGTVLAIKAEEGLVMVSMGKAQGVQAGQVFGVLREGRPIARLKIEKIYPDMSSAKVLPDSLAPGQTVQVHDEVKLPPPHPPRDREGNEGMGQPPMLERGQGEGDGQRPKAPWRPDGEGEGGLGIPDGPPPPRGKGQGDGRDGPPPREGEQGERGEGHRPSPPPPPHPQGMDRGGHDQGGRPMFPPPPRDGEQGERGEGHRPPLPHGPMPPGGQPPKCDKDKNGADEELEF